MDCSLQVQYTITASILEKSDHLFQLGNQACVLNYKTSILVMSNCYYVIYFFSSIASIGGHLIYKVEDTMIYPISNLANRPTNPNESKYVSATIFVDLSQSISLNIQLRQSDT